MKNYLVFGLLVLMAACKPQIESFEDCIAKGYPIMESYPRQCRANGQTFVEQINDPSQNIAEFHECTEQEKMTKACTKEYKPVCAIIDNNIRCVTEPCSSTNASTFGNGCSACAGNAYGYYPNDCQEQLFVVCGETFTGFDPKEYAQRNNGVCVDICPGNFDSYVTQIGVQLCIPHYGVEEIEQWSTCSRSLENCDCVKAYETTQGEEIANAMYRCVPEMYSERLLFRAGLDRLDENGEQSVAIA